MYRRHSPLSSKSHDLVSLPLFERDWRKSNLPAALAAAELAADPVTAARE
jgi:hypothetical protein